MTALFPMALFLLAAEGAGGEHGGNLMLWRVVNFVLLAGLLGWLIKKNAGPFFAARSESILKDLAEARKLSAESEARAKAIEARLARLGEEMDELKARAAAEMASERARLEQETEASLKKVVALAEQEIAAAGKSARQELKAHAAHLAVELAAWKVAGRITPEAQRSLLSAFARKL